MFALSLSGCTTASTCVGISDQAFRDLAGANVSGGSFLVPLASAIASVGVRLGLVIILLFVAMKAADSIAKTGVGAIDKAGGKLGMFVGRTIPMRTLGGVYRNRFGPGGLAKTASGVVAKSGALNTPGFGGWVGYKLRNNVLNPMANKGVGGALSRTQVLDNRKKRQEELAKNRDKIQNKNDVNELARLTGTFNDTRYGELVARNSESVELAKAKATMDGFMRQTKYTGEADGFYSSVAFTSMNPKDKEAYNAAFNKHKKLEDSGVKIMSPEEKGELDRLRENRDRISKLKTTVNSFSKSEVEDNLGKADIEKIIKHISESTMKKIEESEKYAAADKTLLREKWSKEASDASLQKAQAGVDTLKKILVAIEKKNPDFNIQELRRHVESGELVNSSAITSMMQIVNDKTAWLQGKNHGLSEEHAAFGKELFRDFKSELIEIKKEIGKIPTKAAGDDLGPGEFRAK